MTTFLQIHLLTQYPPANLNRDDTGRPKTAMFGDVPRLRISSQALKRAWRTSDGFRKALEGHTGERTRRLGDVVEEHLTAQGTDEKQARRIARTVADVFGKVRPESDKNDKNPTHIEQLAFISPEERQTALEFAARMAAGETIDPKKTPVLRRADTAVDIAMFGRMLADDPDYNREAAVQVAHAITTHKVIVEDDYYTAVDDLKKPTEGAGAEFISETGFAAGLFYIYLCIDRDLLVRNLDGDEALATRGIAALLEAAATESPRGKQASFASRARASYVMIERGATAPRTLAAAFAAPIGGGDILARSIAALEDLRERFASCYGDETEMSRMDVMRSEGSLASLADFVGA
ncbi:MAG: type I-E CRISPR-associated protein Cas7/Cse4/CasC [Geminicoccaceae bacterium]|nr:type I-E CRISPR-associated protein Cas7/Cse4/CasC [Geminicoccaceae bacterium]